MIKISIKKKLLVYNILIQIFIISIFSFSVYKILNISTISKMETSLRVITLDILDDITEHKDEIGSIHFDEEKEYRFKPLYIRLLKDDNSFKSLNTNYFPKDLQNFIIKIEQKDTLLFKEYESYIVGQIDFKISNVNYILQVATNNGVIKETVENLFYILLYIIPIILIFAIIGGYFLIHKSFKPVENILIDLKDINSSTLSKRLQTKSINDEIDMLAFEINSLLQRLEISFDKINQFSSDASHELKTPLTIMRGEIEIALRKDRNTNEYKEVLESSLDEILNIQKTIDDLLFLAKNDEQSKEYNEEVYVDEIVIDSVKELTALAIMNKIKLQLDIKDAFQIKGHSQLLKIAIKNLIKNAIIFSKDDTQVYIKNYIENNESIIEIEDYGIGIPKDEQEKVFEKFYRTDKSRNKNSGGSGLGMAIVEKIITLHNGKIELYSKENIGTKIKIIF